MTKALLTLILAGLVMGGSIAIVSFLHARHQDECDNLQLWGDVTQLKLRGC